MPNVSFLPDEWQGVAALVFVISLGVFAAWARLFGRKEGPPAPKVHEFAVAGQFADMTPLKDLAQTFRILVGLDDPPEGKAVVTLPQLLAVLSAAARTDNELRDLLAAHLADQREEREKREAAEDLEERAKELAATMIKEMTPTRRRRAPARPKP
jgi:hypothetical protein